MTPRRSVLRGVKRCDGGSPASRRTAPFACASVARGECIVIMQDRLRCQLLATWCAFACGWIHRADLKITLGGSGSSSGAGAAALIQRGNQ